MIMRRFEAKSKKDWLRNFEELPETLAYSVPGITEYIQDHSAPAITEEHILELLRAGIGEIGLDSRGRVFFATFGGAEDKEYKSYKVHKIPHIPGWGAKEHLVPGFYEWQLTDDGVGWHVSTQEFPYSWMSAGLGEVKGDWGDWIWTMSFPEEI